MQEEILGLTGIAALGGENPSEPVTLEQHEVPTSYGGYTKLRNVSTSAATPTNIAFDNIRKSYKRDLPWFQSLPDFKKPKGDKKIALVGGGPSLEKYFHELDDFDITISCGSSHDYMVSRGKIPTFAGACDPDPIMANYFRAPNKDTTFLIASACDEKVFEALKEQSVYLWNCYSDDHGDEFRRIDPNFHAIGGGCTIGLRSISIAIMLGYSNIHFFGFDSCMGVGDKHHAYDFTDEVEDSLLGTMYNLRLGIDEPESVVYTVAGYQLAQAYHFKQFYAENGSYFTPTFHGDGLLPDLWKMMKNDYLNTIGANVNER